MPATREMYDGTEGTPLDATEPLLPQEGGQSAEVSTETRAVLIALGAPHIIELSNFEHAKRDEAFGVQRLPLACRQGYLLELLHYGS